MLWTLVNLVVGILRGADLGSTQKMMHIKVHLSVIDRVVPFSTHGWEVGDRLR